MEQAKLLVMADFALPRPALQQTLSEVRLLDWTGIAGLPAFRSGLLEFPEKAETQMTYDGPDAEGDTLLHWCGIRIRISRHLIEFRFPALFKTWLDFPYFRMGLNRFLSTFLRPFQCGSLIFLPSHWTQRESGIHNEWQRKRLQQMQEQITSRENSFKRCRLHLQHCLGETEAHAHSATYPNYVESDFFAVDAGPLCIIAALYAPIAAEELPLHASQTTKHTDFQCCPGLRDNACPFMGYQRYRTAEARPCRLLPFYDRKKYPEPNSAIQTEGIARWNANCFFSMELHQEYLKLHFHRSAPELLYGTYKTEVLDLIHRLLKTFSVREMLLYSAYCTEDLPPDADYDALKQQLSAQYTAYSRLEDIASWSEGYLETERL